MTRAPLPNLGPKSTAWLQAAGVDGLDALAALGAVEAWRRVKAVEPKASLVLLYALQGALLGCHWNDLPPGMKEQLKRDAGR